MPTIALDSPEVEYLAERDFRLCQLMRHVGRGKKRAERVERRAEWFAASLETMAGKDIVCVDPDNGLVVPSAMGGPRENKYVLPEELVSYYAQGSTVICYQHKARRKDPFYIDQLEGLLAREDLPRASGLALKFEKVSQRYYMFVIQPRHKEAVEKVVKDMLSTAWGNHFRLLQQVKSSVPRLHIQGQQRNFGYPILLAKAIGS